MLHLTAGETLLVHGASGGIGHLAVQLATRCGARVLAVASGPDGVQLAKDVGAGAAIDGRSENVDASLREIAPEGVDAMLLTAAADATWLKLIRPGGRVALPTGVPAPPAPPGVQLLTFNGDPDAGILRAFGKHLLEEPRLHVHIGARFPLADVAAAHAALERHHLGKMVLIIP